jgi:LuxR family maltose regulon positive regulatory protein
VRVGHSPAAALGAAQAGVGDGVRALLRSVAQAPAGQAGFGWFETAATGLINDLDRCATDPAGAAARPLILVLDDYHTIRNQAIHNALAFFIDYLPPYVHLTLLTRADPPLPLARLRARDQLVEIRAADLRFRPEEAAAFLNQVAALDLPPEAVANLAARTEGWAAGLHLAALSLQGRDAPARERFVKEFRGTQHHIFAYLVEEVFSRQPPDIQRFLLRTAILSYLTAALCDELMDGAPAPETSRSQAVLSYLERENLFIVPLDEERHWYRYHPLFAEALAARLAEAEGDLVADLQRRAAAWYEAQGLLADAVRHALAAGDQEHAARLVEGAYRRLVMQGEIVLLRAWLDALPAELVRARPRLGLAAAWALGLSDPHEHQEQALRWVAAALGEPWEAADPETESAPSPDPETDKLRGELLALRAVAESLRWECQAAVEHAQAAMWLLWPDSWAEFFQEPPAGPVSQEDIWLRAVILHALGNAYRWSGNVAAAERTYRETLRLTLGDGAPAAGLTPPVGLAAPVGLTPPDGLAPAPAFPMIALTAGLRLGQVLVNQGRLRDAEWVYRDALARAGGQRGDLLPFSGEVWISLGELLTEQGRLAEAEASIHQGIAYCRRAGQPLGEIAGSLARVSLAHALGQTDEAHAELGRAEQLAAGSGRRAAVLPTVAARRAWLSLVTGDSALAGQWADGLAQRRAERQHAPCIIRDLEDLRLAEVRLAQGHLAEAGSILAATLRAAEMAGRHETTIEALTLSACLCRKQGDDARAARTLARALELAAPAGYLRVFVDRGALLAAPLAQVSCDRASDAIGAYAGQLLALVPGRPPPPDADRPAVAAEHLLVEPLTPRELEILGLLAQGAANQEIATQLCLTVGTVKGHINHILGKLAVRNRTEAARRARELGLVEA